MATHPAVPDLKLNSNKDQVRRALDAAVEAIGGQPREGQIEMAEAVANALSDRHHLLVQAGTGTGKSLAYLVPALVHGKKVDRRASCRERVSSPV